jgi:hypothetical protein
MVIAIVCENTFAFRMRYYLNYWAANEGLIPPVMLSIAMIAVTISWARSFSCSMVKLAAVDESLKMRRL